MAAMTIAALTDLLHGRRRFDCGIQTRTSRRGLSRNGDEPEGDGTRGRNQKVFPSHRIIS
jgi:hypothetical protein